MRRAVAALWFVALVGTAAGDAPKEKPAVKWDVSVLEQGLPIKLKSSSAMPLKPAGKPGSSPDSTGFYFVFEFTEDVPNVENVSGPWLRGTLPDGQQASIILFDADNVTIASLDLSGHPLQVQGVITGVKGDAFRCVLMIPNTLLEGATKALIRRKSKGP